MGFVKIPWRILVCFASASSQTLSSSSPLSGGLMLVQFSKPLLCFFGSDSAVSLKLGCTVDSVIVQVSKTLLYQFGSLLHMCSLSMKLGFVWVYAQNQRIPLFNSLFSGNFPTRPTPRISFPGHLDQKAGIFLGLLKNCPCFDMILCNWDCPWGSAMRGEGKKEQIIFLHIVPQLY